MRPANIRRSGLAACTAPRRSLATAGDAVKTGSRDGYDDLGPLSRLRPGLRLGFSVPVLETLSLDLTGGAGALLARRSFETPTFQASESLSGPWLAARLAANWTPLETFVLGAELESGAFWGRLGEDRGAHAFLSASLLAGARF